jgi:predicted N-formylglutamate amidohydrolase
MMNINRIIVTCEHAGNFVPARYRYLFRNNPGILSTHRAWDIGALVFAKRITAFLRIPVHSCKTTRLLIDSNRSLWHRKVFSEFSGSLPDDDKDWLIRNIYRVHRDNVEKKIRARIRLGESILHLSVHSFTPVLKGRVRNADIGLLYDPGHVEEKLFSRVLQREIRRHTELRVRLNYPYRGRSDGLTTALRRIFDSRKYIGLEIELNQSLLGQGGKSPAALADRFCSALRSATGPNEGRRTRSPV